MRSLSVRLMLAFALTSLVGIGLAALFIRQFVVSEFDNYVLTQRRETLVAQLHAYYEANGAWDGVGDVVSLADTQPDAEQPPVAAGAQPPVDDDHRQKVGFMLADAGGTIVLAPVDFMLGKAARADELASGAPITVGGVAVGTLVTLGPPDGRNAAEARYLGRTDLALAVAGVVAVAASLALGFVLAQLITRPVRDLTQASRAIAAGELRQEVPVRSRDELGALARQFNQMSADLHHANELRRRMTADIAHDLRTPLTVIAGYLEALRDESLRPTPARFAAMHDETQVLLHLVSDLHTLALSDAGELSLRLEPVAPRGLLERAAATFEHAAAQAGVAIAVTAAPQGLPELMGDPEQLLRVLRNLVGNALRYTPPGGRVSLAARATGDAVILTVADTGAGIAPEHLANIFERFYRADESRHQATGGSGLGLAIVRSIVEAHGGAVTAESVVGNGTTFTIRLPATRVSGVHLHASGSILSGAVPHV